MSGILASVHERSNAFSASPALANHSSCKSVRRSVRGMSKRWLHRRRPRSSGTHGRRRIPTSSHRFGTAILIFCIRLSAFWVSVAYRHSEFIIRYSLFAIRGTAANHDAPQGKSTEPANNPHKLPSRRSVGSAAEPPWAARTARRHGGCTSLPPKSRSVAAAAVPQSGRHVRRLAA